MSSVILRKKLHEYISTADVKKLKAIYTMVEDDIETNSSYLSPAQKKELDQRLNDYLNNKGKNYSWKETIKKIKNPKN